MGKSNVGGAGRNCLQGSAFSTPACNYTARLLMYAVVKIDGLTT